MKVFLICCLFFVWIATASADCHEKIKCYEHHVNHLINKQIEVELMGHYSYRYLSYAFLQHDRYYPNAAKYFKEKSDEEMTHAERFIDYQNQRGGKLHIRQVEKLSGHQCGNIQKLRDGFHCAKVLEMEVTKALTKLLSEVSDVKIPATTNCSTVLGIPEHRRDLVLAQPIIVTYTENEETQRHYLHEDYCTVEGFDRVQYVELAEMITHEFLGHQIEDTKELANFENTLANFEDEDEMLGSFLADKHFNL